MLEGLEKETREKRKGLCADPASIPPWGMEKARQVRRARFEVLSSEFEVLSLKFRKPRTLPRLAFPACLAFLIRL